MTEEIHISGMVVSLVGALAVMLLGVIAFFLSRLLTQFDSLTAQVSTLNDTMLRIDKDLSGDVGILKTENVTMRNQLDDLDVLFDRVRAVETDLATLKVAGCRIRDRCDQ